MIVNIIGCLLEHGDGVKSIIMSKLEHGDGMTHI